MTPKNRNTTFVNVGMTPEVRALLNAATARAGGLIGRRVPSYRVLRAALAVAERHADEMAAELSEGDATP